MAETLESAILDPIENAFDSMGMMQGEMAPLKRAAFGAAVGYVLSYGIKPGFAFDKTTKKPKEWYFTAAEADKKNSTYVPAWAVVAIPAVIFGVLI
jgi:hypothetical protein